jgi:hypothetical protein
MKKIMFNDRYGLTQAVIEGRKTMTRRLAASKRKYVKMRLWQPCLELEYGLYGCTEDEFWEYIEPHYVPGEVVAVAQSYKDLGYSDFALDRDPKDVQHVRGTLKQSAGWNNKLFVRAEACKHRIRITGIRCERLQDISYAECLKEGVRVEFARNGSPMYYYFDTKRWREVWFDTPREAFAALIDKVSGRGTWASNPWVVVYEFELVK